ncbi:MAG: lysophospholipid acyltransferase family protein [Bacteroidales bacterium]|nr:lysophospholipid acyltransferase family protein [Bacteroidales bacterium]
MAAFSKYFLKAIFFPLSKLPLKVLYAFSGFLAWVLGRLIGYRRADVLVNLSRAFPEKKYKEIKQLYKEYYRHMADIIVETIWFGGCRNPRRLRRARIMEVMNPEVLPAKGENGPSAMILYSHCGNWELYGGIENYFNNTGDCPFTEQNFCVVYKKLSSAAWDEFLRDNRFAPLHDRKNFPGYIESKNLVRHAFNNRDERKFYNINTDQRPYYGGSDTIEVEFMGQKCRTMSAAAAIARKFSMQLFFLRMSIAGRGHYRLEYVPICDDASKMSVQEIMDRYYQLLEAEIREQPYNYLWSHRRWA